MKECVYLRAGSDRVPRAQFAVFWPRGFGFVVKQSSVARQSELSAPCTSCAVEKIGASSMKGDKLDEVIARPFKRI